MGSQQCSSESDSRSGMDPVSRKGRILRLKIGYNPNSSSIGTILFAIPATLLAAGAILGAAMGFVYSSMIRPGERPKRETGERSETAAGPAPPDVESTKESVE